mmetsp:Transcript_52310/g.131383  ORF Transcript_52310/g.131383 Transcript_52310/m.131383 type:complete len:361 (-) Transcript_52310:78-1160(-)
MVHFWLRDEIKPFERRTLLTPSNARALVEAGHTVTVERSTTRCFPDEEFEAAGCRLVDQGTWTTAPSDAVVCGLKELPEGTDPLTHRHIFFAHCFKGQNGWADLLARFDKGGGTIYDLEFLVHENGRRVAAFGWSAGFVGMYTGLLTWARQQLGETMTPISWFPSDDALINETKENLHRAQEKTGKTPSVIIIGALGRCGSGALSLLKAVGLKATEWDMAETAKGGPFDEITQHNIFVNCIALTQRMPPFLTMEQCTRPESALSVVVDVSCDYTNPFNPLPIYNASTTFAQPTLRVSTTPVVDVVSIDHLPSAVPVSSSKEFSDAMTVYLKDFPNTPVWDRAFKIFEDKRNAAREVNKNK